MKTDEFAEITWLVNDSLRLEFGIFDLAGRTLEAGDSIESDSAFFVAPSDGEYTLVVRLDESPEVKEPQDITLEYKTSFRLPPGTKLKGVRRINGYDVKIFTSAGGDQRPGFSTVVVEKNGRLKKVIRAAGGLDYMGFSFPDQTDPSASAEQKRSAALIRSTPDKTGNGVPDVMIDYFSGGAHCCSSSYFIDLGPRPELVEVVHTEHAGITAIGRNPKGGLRFATNENSFAYWNIHYAGSPAPEVILEFAKGKLRPNFDLMKKPAPALASLKSKARAARAKIDLSPYTEDSGDFEEAFWGEMLELIYTGHEALAWQYFDLAWPAGKQGRELFIADFKKQLSTSYYGTKEINTGSSFENFEKGLLKALKEIREQQPAEKQP